MTQKKPFVIDNLRRVNSLSSFKKEGVQSAVAVPVCAGEEVLGVLLVGSRKTRTFRRNDVRFLEFIGNQMGIAVQKAQLYEKARTQTEELEKANAQLHARARREAALAELGQSALGTADLVQLMNEAVALVAQTLRVDLCKILELLPDEKALLLRAGIGWKEGLVGRLELAAETSSQAGYTLFSREPVVVEDLKTETRFSGPALLYDHGVVSGISVVIHGRERPFGVLGAHTVKRQTFAPDDIHFLQAVANVLSVTIERKRAEEALGARYQELVTLKEIGQTILASQDIKTVLDTILDQAVTVGAFDMGSILIVDSSGKHLDRVAMRGYRHQEVIQERHRDIASEQSRFRTLRLQEPRVEENVPASTGSNRLKREGVQSAIMVPVRASDTIFGVIQLGSRRPRKFLPGEVRILETLGHQMGIALQKHRLYEQTSRNLERIRALHEIDIAITSTLDLPKILEVLLQKIDLFLPYTAASGIRLLNKATGALDPVACRNLDEKEWKADPLKGGHGIGTALKATNVPMMIADMQKDPRTTTVEFIRKNGLVSFLGAPLIANDEFLGVLSLYTKEEHEFTKEEVEFIATLGSEAAIAIQNAGLYANLRNQAVELEQANRVKSEFLSVMSHELRTPLNVIMGYTALIQDQILGEINADQERALERLSEQSDVLLHLISSIMEATKIEAGSVILEKSEVNLKSLLDELKKTFKSPRNEVAISWTYPEYFPPVVTDGAKLKQIMQGLISNALKFTEQGFVEISASLGKNVETDANMANRFLRIEVKDTGIGIPTKALSTIFEIFRQLDSSETRAYGGLGLGLYLVKRFTELLGGKIEVESEEGKGSTFIAVIPVLQTLQ